VEASQVLVAVLLILQTPLSGQPVLLTGLLLSTLLAIKLVGRHRAARSTRLISRSADAAWGRLYQTPQQIKMPLGSGRVWFSDITRTIPLRQFGYPNNQQLSFDLGRYAPHLLHYLHATADPRG
jgi:hypothetical protein